MPIGYSELYFLIFILPLYAAPQQGVLRILPDPSWVPGAVPGGKACMGEEALLMCSPEAVPSPHPPLPFSHLVNISGKHFWANLPETCGFGQYIHQVINSLSSVYFSMHISLSGAQVCSEHVVVDNYWKDICVNLVISQSALHGVGTHKQADGLAQLEDDKHFHNLWPQWCSLPARPIMIMPLANMYSSRVSSAHLCEGFFGCTVPLKREAFVPTWVL